MSKTRLVFLLLFLGMAAFLYHQRETILQLRRENSALQHQRGELNRLREENERLSAEKLDQAEVAKLKVDHSELLRLRGEVSRLKRQTPTAPATQPITVRTEDRALPEVLTNDLLQFTTNLTVELQRGETSLTSWDAGNGMKAYLFVTPEFVDPAGNLTSVATSDTQVLLNARFLNLPAEKARSEFGGKLASSRLPQAELKDLITALKQDGSVEFHAAPRVLTANGRQAQVMTTQNVELDGQKIPLVRSFDLLPIISADGTSVSIVIDAAITSRGSAQ